jgi:YaiO family outer membrane protein
MNHKIKIIISAVLYSNLLFSQINTDSLFLRARDYSFSGNYEQARIICNQILEYNNEYIEPQILIARTFSWEGNFDSARFVLKKVLNSDSLNYDALDLSISIENWDENYVKALFWCEKALNYYPDNEKFLLQKGKTLKNSKNYVEALGTVEHLLELYPDNKEAKILLIQLKFLMAKNEISLGYSINIFQNSDLKPWHLAYLQYTRKTQLGPFIARINLANRFEIFGYQYELEAYPKISSKNYAYLNIGYSESRIFPRWRFGAEFYHSFSHNFEVGLGFRHLIFDTTNVTILTGYLGKYIGSFWFSLHSYVTPINNKITVSEIFLMRKYFSNPENYLGLLIGYGVSPDDRIDLFIDKNDPALNSLTCKLSFNHLIKSFWIINTGVGFTLDEYIIDNYRNIYTFEIEITRLF